MDRALETQGTSAPIGRNAPGRSAVALAGWGRYPVQKASELWPASRGALDDCLSRPYHPRGLGRSYGDAGLPAEGHAAVNGGLLDRFLSFRPETGVLEAEAGVSLARILEVFVPKGWFLPVTPGTASVTLGGAVASNVHGKNHHRSGSIEHFVERLEVATPRGPVACSPSENAELFRATVGGYGLTGFITRASLRLKSVRSPRVTCERLRARGLDDLFRLFRERDGGSEYSVAWLDAMARGRALGRGILMLADHESGPAPAIADPALAAGAAPRPQRRRLAVPFPMPGFLLRPALLAAANRAFYRFGRTGGPAPEAFDAFFYPLDAVRDWNLLYGPRGFLQYQCVIPDPGEDGIAACLDYLARNRLGSFLSVLKRCGDDAVLLPFCRRGYTLALDIPRRGATLRLLAGLDDLVLRHRGRVYLTKDARLPRETFRAMYPERKDWMAAVKRYNPEGLGKSRMAERLGLWEE